jgi:23S rRNA pseudouridine1911/1915/1917 synthase
MSLGETKLEVIFEDNHLLAVNKPAMLATMGVAGERDSLLIRAKEFLRQKYAKPGNVYVGVVSRLDAPVTGLVLLAKTSKAAARLSEAFRERRVNKTYLAVVAGTPSTEIGELEDYLRKDERHRKMHITHRSHPEAQACRLSYQLIEASDDLSLLEVHPETGRKHQIRVQLSHVAHPIVGDRKYGSSLQFSPGIALHSFRLELEHLVRHDSLVLEASVSSAWRRHRAIGRLIGSI